MGLGAEVLPAAAPAPGMTPQNDLHAKWMTYLTAPQTRAAMMQFGVGMLQSRTGGQSLAGQVGQSIGEAGQAAGRVQASQLEIGKQSRLEARDQARLENEKAQVGVAQEGNVIAAKRAETDASQAATAAQTAKDQLALDKEKLELSKFQAKSLDLYYKSLANAASVKAAPVGYKEALDALKESSLLADDPMMAFMGGLPALNQQFGIAAPGSTASPAAPAAPAPASTPTPGAAVPPPDAVNLLRQDPSPANKQYFDQVFGPGAADRAIAGQ